MSCAPETKRIATKKVFCQAHVIKRRKRCRGRMVWSLRAMSDGAPCRWSRASRSRRARAQDDNAGRRADSFEDRRLFGFTQGSDVGEPGSREAEYTSTGAFGKRGVSCEAVEQEAAYDAAATDRFGDESIGSALYVGPTMHLQMGPKAFCRWSGRRLVALVNGGGDRGLEPVRSLAAESADGVRRRALMSARRATPDYFPLISQLVLCGISIAV